MDYARLFADRIGGARFGTTQEIYKFEKIKRAKAAARQARPDVELLDFGVGEPDRMAPDAIRDALKAAVDRPENRGYADTGLDPDTEINHSIGSKPALALLPLCFVNPGDVVLTTVPGYPVLATHARYLGGEVVKLPLKRENGFLPELDRIDPALAGRAKLFYVNYPNNPTGAAATPEFFDRLIAFARKHQVLIVQDAAYATLIYNGPRLSILSRPAGKDCAIELHSMSKSYNMTGWRLGFAAGHARIIQAFAEVKDNIDSGQFKAIQQAACAGIADLQLSESIREHYRARLEKLVAVLRAAGFEAQMPGGTFYLYVPAPRRAGSVEFRTAEDASQHLIREHSISTVPWDDAGHFLRFSATWESKGDADDARVLHELRDRLARAQLQF